MHISAYKHSKRESVLSNNNLPTPIRISQSGPVCTLNRRKLMLRCMLIITLRTGELLGKHQYYKQMYRTNENRVQMCKGGRNQAGRGNLILMQKENECRKSEAGLNTKEQQSSHPSSWASGITGEPKSP